MFHRIGNKLRNSAANKLQKKPTRISSPSSAGNQPPTPASPAPSYLNDGESLDSYSAFHAEFLFPIDDHQAATTPSFDHQFDSSSSFSHSDENEHSFPASSTVLEDELNLGPPVLPDYNEAEEQFLEDFEDYFENLSVDNIRREQYLNLDLQKIIHLDYANNPLFSQSQVEEHMRFLLEEAPCSGAVSESNFHFQSRISRLDERFLSLFNTRKEDYVLFFTAGLSGSFKLLGEVYPFDRSTQLLVCQDTHEQIRSLIPSAARSGSRTTIVPVKSSDLCIPAAEFSRLLHKTSSRLTSQGGLAIFPAQSKLSANFHPLEWIREVQSQHGWHAAVDVSMLLPAAGSLDLSAHQPEFVVGSVGNALGYPPATGFLLVKREFHPQVLKRLRKNQTSAREVAGIYLVGDEMRLIDLVGVASGLEQLESTGLDAIHKRGICLASWLRTQMKRFKHRDHESKSVIRLYGSGEGSIVAFNLVDSTGNLFPPRIVQKLAEKQNIKLGICGFRNHPLLLSGKSASLAGFSAVTLSLGCVSSFQDCYRFIHFLMRFRDEEYLSSEAMGYIEESKMQT